MEVNGGSLEANGDVLEVNCYNQEINGVEDLIPIGLLLACNHNGECLMVTLKDNTMADTRKKDSLNAWKYAW